MNQTNDRIKQYNGFNTRPYGWGWLGDYCMCLLKNYQQFTMNYIMNELPMLDGWLLYSYAILNDPVHKFSGLQLKDGGPAGDEADALKKELLEIINKPQTI